MTPWWCVGATQVARARRQCRRVWPATALLEELPALPPGTYSADIHLIMSDTHCDGQTNDFAMSCLPPGDSLALTRTFVVQP